MEPELKVVLELKGTRVLIGIQGPGTDPVVEVLTAGTLEEALATIPEVLARAREKWAQSPKNPAYVGPPPPPAQPAPARIDLATPATRRAVSQQRFF